MPPCPSDEQLEQYHRDDLPAEAADAIGRHARGCPACQSRISSLADTVTMLEDVRTVLERQSHGLGPTLPGTLEGETFGGYQVGSLLGEGGMARVYGAIRTADSREVALKVLKHEVMASEDICARFEREARAMARIEHPNVVTVFDCPRDRGTTAIAMELLEGGTLRSWADQQRSSDTRPNIDRVVRFALQAAQGLAAAHKLGLVHRDIKPANLMFDHEGVLKLVDFGVVQALESATWVTGLGHHIGTPAYMSPEQCKGERASQASDIYSLGVTIYELLANRLPLGVESPSPFAQMLKHISEMPTDLRDQNHAVPDWLGDVVMKCLAKNPEDRFSDGAALAQALVEGRQAKGQQPAADQSQGTWHLNLDVVRRQLRRLPQRAIVSWACRRARFVQHLNSDRRVEQAIAMADAACRSVDNSRGTARALQRVRQLRAASLKAAYTEQDESKGEAASMAACAAAATSACAAAKSVNDAAADAAFVAECAVAALCAAGKSARPFWKSARRDYKRLLDGKFGQEGTIGDPVPESFWRDRND
ncbi:MAG: serine/threonine protein kinase [Phycisphaerae bacterium]|nr:serine/threonine protein kinase [Phycisphaerae bacterium]